MSNLATQNTQIMSSIEISELAVKQHKHVLTDIRNMLKELEIDAAEFSATQKYGNNNIREIFNLNEELTLTLVSGYNLKMRNAIIKRWKELEEQEKRAVPQNYSEALQLAADQAKELEIIGEQTKLNAPKVEFADILTKSTHTRCVRVWVKGMKSDYGLRVGEREVFKWLRDKKYIFRDRSLGNLPSAKYESSGLSYFSLAGIEDSKGVVRQSLQVTGKGMFALTGKVVEHFSNEVEL